MILLDTNVLSELMRLSPNKKVVENVNKFPASLTFISAVTHAEILQGIALLDEGKRKQKLSKVADQILQLFDHNTLAFDKHSSRFYADIIQQRTQLGRPIDYPDAQIAAIALQHDLQLFTRNVRDFEKIGNLRLLNPWA
ncbi:MAG: type II toxin-antitoxin system VapC family toxin [Methyloprofundus sp.]|nr:type II toxin-antitoxin system VapC family toxin [Methyloprofundus sp.]